MASSGGYVNLRTVPGLATIGLAGYVLVRLTPSTLASAQQAQSADALVTAACAVTGLALLAWLACASVICVIAVLPGWVGHAAGRLAARTVPAAIRGCVRVSLGLGTSVVVGTSSVVTLAALSPASALAATSVSVSVSASAATSTPIPRPANVWPSLDRAPLPSHPVRPDLRAAGYDVRAGDTLWGIAARTLGPDATPAEVADTWPRWWERNRAVIGANPDLIQPGQHLDAPERRQR
jgi:LysM repeat protein